MTDQTSPDDAMRDGRADGKHDSDPHHTSLVSTEMRRLERRLREFGPMPKTRLEQECGSANWREGTFEEAVHEGIRTGRLKQLALGWIEAVSDGDRPPAA